MNNATFRLIGMLLLLVALPLAASAPSDRLPGERALRAAAALGMGADPAVFARTLDRPLTAQDPDLSLRLRFSVDPKGRPMDRPAPREALRTVSSSATSPGTTCVLSAQGSVSGQVNDADGTLSEGIEVTLIPEGWIDPSMDLGYMPLTTISGPPIPRDGFSIPFSEAGDYRVMARDPSSLHLPQYYGPRLLVGQRRRADLGGGTGGVRSFLPPRQGRIHRRPVDRRLHRRRHLGMYVFAYSLDAAPWDAAGVWAPPLA